ncbi:aminotransferase [Candidatus Koribacter versatilis Ellin345]|uniref:alanine transaminase n=2 Tax=Candidatus Korobacter versatilis TaxID=658062 RepID=Q1IPB1_KORVE|nr:aminotransferase [Candidatus Koribacter versatilis Ellin345]
MFSRRTNWNLATNRYTQAIEEHKKHGRELLDLAASNPTNIGLQYDSNRILDALRNPASMAYEPISKGLMSARQAVAGYYQKIGVEIAPEQLVLTTSTSEAYSFCFRLLCEPGDEVLVPTPSYPLFDFLAEIQDVRLLPYELVYDHGWQMDFHSLQQRLTDRSRAVIVVHPNNPTGSFVKTHEMAQLSELCRERKVAIVADEVFLDYRIGDRSASSFTANDKCLTLTMSGLSKISGLPQMKVAWIAVSGPDALKNEALARLDVIADTYLSMNAPIQHAIPVMLEERHSVQRQLNQRIVVNLAELDRQLAQQKIVTRLDVEGGWYAILRVPALRSDEDLAIELIEKYDVLVQPGHFYDFRSDGYLIISLITPEATFREGLTRTFECLAALSC